MTEIRVEHRERGILGTVIRDNEKPIVRWDDTGKQTIESWEELVRLDGEPTLDDFELPPGMYSDSDMGCTE